MFISVDDHHDIIGTPCDLFKELINARSLQGIRFTPALCGQPLP